MRPLAVHDIDAYARGRLSESEKTDAWRLHVLIEAGYPTVLAERLAGCRDVDTHRAIELLKRGCSSELAGQILL